jgi:hypothetical protein
MKSCSYARYPAKATVAIPRPGNDPRNRLARVNGPEYRQASLDSSQFHRPELAVVV